MRSRAGTAKLPAAEMMAYLRMTVRNLALNGSRRRRLKARIFDTQSDTQVIDIAADMPDPAATALSRDEYARIMAALKKMPENLRIAVELPSISAKQLKESHAIFGGSPK